MKKWTKAFLATLLCCVLSYPAYASAEQPSVYVDGSMVAFQENQPLIINGRTMIPLREMFRVFSFDASYHGDTQTIYIKNEEMKVFFRIGNLRFFIEKDSLITHSDLDVAPLLIDSRTYVPLRAIAEVMGAKVEWDAQTSSVQITLKS